MRNNILLAKNSEKFGEAIGKIKVPENPPMLILIAGPCRVGTTALGNVFARAGHVSYMQPIKSIRRAIESGEEVPEWNIDDKQKVVVSKETFGAKTESEFYDPIEILLAAGYPKEKIHLIGIMREPGATLTSWTWMWDRVFFKGFIRSYKDTFDTMARAKRLGVATTHYVHEAIRDNEPGLVVGKLFERIIPNERVQASGQLVDWSKGANFDQATEVKFFDSPPERFVHAVKTWGGYQYRELVPDLTSRQKRLLAEARIDKIYDYFLKMCEQKLEIKIPKERSLEKTVEKDDE